MTSRRHDDAARAIARLQRRLSDYALKGHRHSGPRGVLGYAEATSTQSTITSAVDRTGLSVTVDVAADRRIRIKAFSLLGSTVNNNIGELAIQEDGSQITLSRQFLRSGENLGCHAEIVRTPSAGSRIYKVQVALVSGSGSISSAAAISAPAFILVEDLGAA